MGMKKFLSRTVAVITTAAMLISYGGVMSTEASEYEPDSEEESIVVEEEYTTEDISEDATEEEMEAEAEDEETEAAAEETTAEDTTDETAEEDVQVATEITDDVSEEYSQTTTEAVESATTETATEECPQGTQATTEETSEEATSSASLMASSNYTYTVLSKSKKTIEITGYTGSAKKLTIPSKINGYKVTSIGGGAFYGSAITSVTIPSTVTSIGNQAFDQCHSLTSVTIPSSVTSIGEMALHSCNLKSLTIPSSVTSIGEDAFGLNENLTKITVNSNNKKFSSKNGVLYNKKKTKLICCPGGKTGIFTVPSSVTSIGAFAFFGCLKLNKVKIPNSVTNIEKFAFYCSGIKSIKIPDSVTSIGGEAFEDCGNLTSIEISDGVKSIGTQAFQDCTNLISIEIPGSVTKIEYDAFSGCINLRKVVISEGAKSIGVDAFAGCSSLTNVEIPSSVTSIGAYAFSGCENLTDIYYSGTKTKWNKISFGTEWNYDCPDDQTVFYGIKSVSLKTSSYTYNGSAKKPGVVVKDADGNTLSSKYYSVSYKNNKKVGTGTVKIKFKNGYSGTATQTFIIKPKGATLSSVTKSSKAFTVKWKKQSTKMSTSTVTGYQIQYSTSSSFSSGNKTVTVSGYTSTSKKITGLKSNTKYYVRIRTYKSISGTKYYSGWSSAKSVTTK